MFENLIRKAFVIFCIIYRNMKDNIQILIAMCANNLSLVQLRHKKESKMPSCRRLTQTKITSLKNSCSSVRRTKFD